MSIPTYRSGFPQDGSSLGSTKAQIRANLDGTFQTLAIDHIDNNGSPGSQPPGYHKTIHMVPRPGNPAPIATIGQLYTRTITSVATDTALFFESGGGLVSQLTMNIAPSANPNGYTYLPGGILLQWGVVNGLHGSNGHFNDGDASTVTFATANIAFPTTCFGVWTNLLYNTNTGSVPSGTGNVSYNQFTLSRTKFDWVISTSSSQYVQFFWVAIGK